MAQFSDEWLEHQRKRFTRPDGDRYLRPDASRTMRPDPKLYLQSAAYQRWLREQANSQESKSILDPVIAREIEVIREDLAVLREIAALQRELKFRRLLRDAKAYNPDQPRVPAGNPDGGQWTDEDGGSIESSVLSDADPDQITLGTQVAANGHHYIPRGVFEKEKYSFSPDTLLILENAATGPLNDPTSNRYDDLHRQYNKAVEEQLDGFLKRNNIRGDQMTQDQARSFVAEIKTSRDPRIRQFNIRLWMREINHWLRRGPRGRE